MLIITVIVGLSQYFQTINLEKKRVAIEVVYKNQEPEFLRSFARLETISKNINASDVKFILKKIYKIRDDDNFNLMVDDINYILNTYEYISMLYYNNLVDRETIKQGIYPRINIFLDIFNRLKKYLPDKLNIENIQRLSQRCAKYDKEGKL
jgi:hypothetical protein